MDLSRYPIGPHRNPLGQVYARAVLNPRENPNHPEFYGLDARELRIDVMGAVTVRVTHLPTALSVTAGEADTVQANQRQAYERVRAALNGE